ncbi:Vacuolar inheritance and morphology protein [Mucor velutinosus]|uniref:Vacuolar inheritance and morphology protein n=1 Tax=Mucor velutinosus TaxID=708070 RepID=A0AAN7HZE2_9FUNG|nr:Vacuolar inheritance and morphology protein [Mucor velutinosus]
MSAEKVFVIGATGNIGVKAVNDLLDHKIPVTLFARSPEKVASLFSSDLVNVIQGDFKDLSPIKEGIKGHTRLFLLVSDFYDFVNIKKTIATYAYEAGVKQIVDISSLVVNLGWRSTSIGSIHYYAEKAIYDIPNRGHFVALRPGRFTSNHLGMMRPLADKGLFDNGAPDSPQGWISTNDIGAVAAVVLREDVNKHMDAVYSLIGDVVTSNERAAILTRITGQNIKYTQISPVHKYHKIMESGHIPHVFALDLVTDLDGHDDKTTPIIEILLGRKSETVEEYLTANKNNLK